ncbi:hypothetical protein RND81_11G225600 [Saponaria officinalis]|uniref:DUF4378 domain-containing protein n=1 Tax=Saponaria officinalis TaxID=3572 RepID=A0AAW1HRB3_SAPOF
MGGLFHLFDYYYGNRKHKKQGDVSVDAPRNSLELPAETWQNQYTAKDGEQDLPKKSYIPADAPMKTLICDEISKPSNTKQNAPSIVARLMGMDVLPEDNKPEVRPLQNNDARIEITDKKVQHIEKVSTVNSLQKSKSASKKEHRSYKDAYSRYWNYAKNSGKPRPRVHPQEKELQKFKKEFEAWQAARFLECARVVELGNIPDQWLAQLDLTKEKMALYETSRKIVVEKTVKQKSTTSSNRLRSRSLRSVDSFPSEHKESYSFSGITSASGRDFEMNSDRYSEPTKIVILKPGPDSFSTANDDSWITSTSSMDDRDCIEDLLEEVKERLRCEMQGKAFRNGSMVRGGGIETPYKEKPAFNKPNNQIIRETASRDPGQKLHRSESARSYRGEFLANELAPSSPEFMTRDSRKVHERRSNLSDGFPREAFFDDARARLEQVRDILNAESGSNYWRDLNCNKEMQHMSFRHDVKDDKFAQEQPSPRSLVRSLSAPVSGMSFGKLLLEDRHVSSGAQIKRKHEALTDFSADGQRKERFNFREKIKSRLSLRKKLFSKKLQSMDFSECSEYDSEKDVSVAGFADRIENLTEVPPSPASVCSSVHEDFWKPMENPSPISMSDVTSVGDHSVGNAFRDISSNLTELRKQLNQLDYEGSEITTVTEDPSELEVADIEDEAEAYIKNLLVISGFYDGSWVQSFSRWDPFVKPMGNWIFEKVEESYRKPTNDSEDIDYDEMSLEHKLLFDLLNEALTVLLGPQKILSKFRRKITEITISPLPQGRKLLNQVWEMICEYLNPSVDPAYYSLDDLVADDLNSMPWSNVIDEEMSALGKTLEDFITEELVEELVLDMEF